METEPTVPGSGKKDGRQVVKPDAATVAATPDAATQVIPSSPASGSTLPHTLQRGRKYEIGRVVARGGMGAILDAKETAIERTVAMKVVLDAESPDALARFVTEGKVTGQLEHPNIVPVHELGVDEQQQVFYTMKFVRGDTLRKVLEQLAAGDAETIKKYPLSHLLTIFQKVCDAMAFAHSKGVIHRDLKPENIMLGDFGEVLVMDWGLAKVIGHREQAAPEQRTLVSTKSLEEMGKEGTMAGTIMGMPQYMPPEQAHGRIEQLDARSDIYSLGAILYHILTLQPSVTGDNVMQVLFKVSNGEITPPSQIQNPKSKIQHFPHLPGGRVPESLSAVTMKAMALKQGDRYQSVPELQREIEAYQNGFATSAENAGFLKLLALMVKRHQREFAISFAALFILLSFSVWFVINLRASERAARAAEAVAVEEKENTRQALAKADIALAEATYREGDALAMQTALNGVPDDLRDTNWDYLLEKSDTSIATLRTRGGLAPVHAIPHPKQPGVFAIVSYHGLAEFVVARTGARLLEFQAGFEQKTSGEYWMAFSPDAERLAIGHAGGGITIHSARDGKKLMEWVTDHLKGLQFSPDGQQLLERERDNDYFSLWDTATGRLLWKTSKRGRLVFDPAGQFVLAAFNDKIRLLNPKDGTVLRELADVRHGVASIAIRSDGNRALVGQQNGFVRCVDLKDGRVLFETRIASVDVLVVAYTPDGSRFVTRTALSGNRPSLQVWDAESGRSLQTLLGGGISSFSTHWISIHPLSGELMASGNPMKVWDIVGGQNAKWRFTSHNGTRNVAFWKTDDMVFMNQFLGKDRMTLLDLRHKEPLEIPLWTGARDRRRFVNTSADGRFAVVCGELPIFVDFLRLNGSKAEQVHAFKSKNEVIQTFALSPTGERLWLNDCVMDPTTGAELSHVDRREIRRFNCAGWLNKTQAVTAVSAKAFRGQFRSEEQMILWDTTTGQRLRSVVHPTVILALAVAPDGKTFAEAGADKMVRLRDAATLEVLDEFRAHDDAITALAFHSNRPILATGSADLTIKLWNLDTGGQLDELRGHTAPLRDVTFSPSGRRLASLSANDRATRIWEPDSLNPDATKAKVSADGWEDPFAQLKRDVVAKTGNGWQLNNGVLFSPDRRFATFALQGHFGQSGYQVRVKLRQLTPRKGITIFFPVADHQAQFGLDAWAERGYGTGLSPVDGKRMPEGVVKGRQIQDSEQHELHLTVEMNNGNVRFEARLDDQPIYQWSGLASRLSVSTDCWKDVPAGTLSLGAQSADWVVYAVKVKRLEGKP